MTASDIYVTNFENWLDICLCSGITFVSCVLNYFKYFPLLCLLSLTAIIIIEQISTSCHGKVEKIPGILVCYKAINFKMEKLCDMTLWCCCFHSAIPEDALNDDSDNEDKENPDSKISSKFLQVLKKHIFVHNVFVLDGWQYCCCLSFVVVFVCY